MNETLILCIARLLFVCRRIDSFRKIWCWVVALNCFANIHEINNVKHNSTKSCRFTSFFQFIIYGNLRSILCKWIRENIVHNLLEKRCYFWTIHYHDHSVQNMAYDIVFPSNPSVKWIFVKEIGFWMSHALVFDKCIVSQSFHFDFWPITYFWEKYTDLYNLNCSKNHK